MKALLVLVAIVVIAVVILFFILGQASASGKAIGLVDERLAECPTKPNCVCSEYRSDSKHYIDPIVLTKESLAESKTELKNIIQQMGGKVEDETDSYIAAIFRSNVFRFVDDFEIRIDTHKNIIHIRSASRVGYSDAGINRKRVESLRMMLLAELDS